MSSTTKRPITLDQAIRPALRADDPKGETWHAERTRQAVKEADAGDFATATEVAAALRKFRRHG